MFEKLTHPYKDPDHPDVKLLPAFHGTKKEILDSLFRTGYASLATTDKGYFGKGIYSSHEAEYAHRCYSSVHENGVLILNWLAIFSALPVIGGELPLDSTTKPEVYGEIHGDQYQLEGRGNYANYDAHFIPVGNPNNPKGQGLIYYPCEPKVGHQDHQYTEIVVFEAAACLPRFLIQLQPTLVKAPPKKYEPKKETNQNYKYKN